MSDDRRSTIRLSQYGYQAQIAPSITRHGSVVVGFYNAAGDASTNPGCFTPAEWDAFVAAGNRALGREPTLAVPSATAVALAAERAAAFAVHAHGEQLYGHEPYSVHLEAVRAVMRDFSIVGDLATAAWLHDVLEDTKTTRQQIADAFGEGVAALVEAVTGRGPNRKARVADVYAKIEALPDAVFLKLGDRIANVEASPIGSHWLPMYAAEQPGFEAMIARAGMTSHPKVQRMLARLRAALRVPV